MNTSDPLVTSSLKKLDLTNEQLSSLESDTYWSLSSVLTSL